MVTSFNADNFNRKTSITITDFCLYYKFHSFSINFFKKGDENTKLAHFDNLKLIIENKCIADNDR